MPHTIHEEALRDSQKVALDVTAPDYVATKGADGHFRHQPGIPVRNIPILEFPRVVYKHPKEPYFRKEHRNKEHEIVDVEMLPAEALSRVVGDEAELKAALAEGYVKDPYIAPAPPDPNAHLYEGKTAKK